jgi:hypothetical protein
MLTWYLQTGDCLLIYSWHGCRAKKLHTQQGRHQHTNIQQRFTLSAVPPLCMPHACSTHNEPLTSSQYQLSSECCFLELLLVQRSVESAREQLRWAVSVIAETQPPLHEVQALAVHAIQCLPDCYLKYPSHEIAKMSHARRQFALQLDKDGVTSSIFAFKSLCLESCCLSA